MSKPTTIKIDEVEYIRKDSIQVTPKLGPEVLVRTYGAGVHIGHKALIEGRTVHLKNARRLWSWKGAFTLNAAATKGVDRSGSRISCSVPEIILLDAIEVIPVAEGVDLSTTEK